MKWPVVSFTAVVNVPDSVQAQLRRCPTIYYSRRRKNSVGSAAQELLSSQSSQSLHGFSQRRRTDNSKRFWVQNDRQSVREMKSRGVVRRLGFDLRFPNKLLSNDRRQTMRSTTRAEFDVQKCLSYRNINVLPQKIYGWDRAESKV